MHELARKGFDETIGDDAGQRQHVVRHVRQRDNELPECKEQYDRRRGPRGGRQVAPIERPRRRPRTLQPWLRLLHPGPRPVLRPERRRALQPGRQPALRPRQLPAVVMRARFSSTYSNAVPVDPAAHAGGEFDKAPVLQHLDSARARQIDLNHVQHASRARCHHDDRVGEQHGFSDAVGDEEHGVAAHAPDLLQLESHPLAGHHVECAETVRPRVSAGGLRSRARQIAARCCMPPDNSCGYASSNPARPASSISSSARTRWAAAFFPPTSATNRMLANVVRQGSSTGVWNTMLAPAIGPATVCPRTLIRPADGAMRPATRRSNVDLPQPLGPTMETNSFSSTSNAARSTGNRVPNVLLTSAICSATLIAGTLGRAAARGRTGPAAALHAIDRRCAARTQQLSPACRFASAAEHRDVYVLRGKLGIELERTLDEIERALHALRRRHAVAIFFHIRRVDRLDRLPPLGERRVVVEGRIVLDHDLRRFLGVRDRVLDGLCGGLRKALRAIRVLRQRLGAGDEHVAEHVVAPVGERGEIDFLAARRGDLLQRGHIAVDRGGEQIGLAAEEQRGIDARVGRQPFEPVRRQLAALQQHRHRDAGAIGLRRSDLLALQRFQRRIRLERGQAAGADIHEHHEALDLRALGDALDRRTGIGHPVVGLAAVDRGDDKAAAGRRLDLDIEAGFLVEAFVEPDKERRVAAVKNVIGQECDFLERRCALGGRSQRSRGGREADADGQGCAEDGP